MKNQTKAERLTRAIVLNTLSDDEIAKVSTAETADNIPRGDDYLDLECLDKGVQHSDGKSASMGRVLPRKAVHAKTWDKLVAQLSSQ
jgi:hypothetical protein